MLTQWAEKFSLHKKEDIWPADIDLILRYVRVLLFQRQYDQAMQVLSQLLLSAEADQRTGHIIEILTLQSLVRQGQGDTKRALTILQNALQLAQPQGYIRLFVDEGPAMAALLNLLANHPQVGAYARQLLEVYGDFVKTESAVETTPAGLLEPLSEKELETLRYMMSGLNNKEIGDKMFVSNNTIKTHIKHIYQKLQVNSRTQAVLRARELNLLQ